ncbi:MAG TPA: tail fiber domain-containing protein [Chthoniobacterales bacterium]|nr:tail fiber domain-containing protein [Chthoniobacterales bacterium]
MKRVRIFQVQRGLLLGLTAFRSLARSLAEESASKAGAHPVALTPMLVRRFRSTQPEEENQMQPQSTSLSQIRTLQTVGQPWPRLRSVLLFSALAAAALAWTPDARAGSNTFLGDFALGSVTTGQHDSAFGYGALYYTTSGSFNSAFGSYALFYNITGSNNTAIGYYALLNNTDGFYNTANGYSALEANTSGDSNVANGAYALRSNSSGFNNTANGIYSLYNNTNGYYNTGEGSYSLYFTTSGTNNTANGAYSLFANTTGSGNVASGYFALSSNSSANYNTAIGNNALYSNTTGGSNTAVGASALSANTTAFNNTAVGLTALFRNTTGTGNTAEGTQALAGNTTGNFNTGLGFSVLYTNTTGGNNVALGPNAMFHNTTGAYNIALGFGAGTNLTTGNSNIDIGNAGVAAEANTIRIGAAQTRAFLAGVKNAVTAAGVPVYVNASGQLGTNPSSRRFKEDIAAMAEQSEAILALQPVIFRYKPELDAQKTAQFGLIAEDVAKINPDLVTRDDKGEIFSVRYEAINAMLLNEFLKEHKKVEQLQKDFQTTVTQQQQQISELTAALKEQAAQIQRVSAQMAVQKSTAEDNQAVAAK